MMLRSKGKPFILLISLLLVLGKLTAVAQGYWQQRVDYKMEIDFQVSDHTFSGKQVLTYRNNSPDTLHRVFYHLYFNAFQPGSMMDVRSQNLPDPDRRVMDRISKLRENETGRLYPTELDMNGKPLEYKVEGTILEVDLPEPLLPGTSTVFTMEFEGQVPIQIRRSGRNNREGIDYSMAQWYPKMANYDRQGWHANPYVAREFYGIWGDFDVKITIDPTYVIAATGILQNPDEIGYGYEDKGVEVKRRKGPLTWHFVAENVIDFVWAADPDYTHLRHQVEDGPELHFFYVSDSDTEKIWPNLPGPTADAFRYMNERFGRYPYPKYSVIQGGDGGMEYPMATLINGKGSFGGVFGTTVHELIHSWYQNTLATNESLYSWMDEGFTSYASGETIRAISDRPSGQRNPNRYRRFIGFMESGIAEPSSTHSDHFDTNRAYSTSAYTKGALFLSQLSYIMGMETFNRGMKRYYNTWKFKHPTPDDFIRVMEKESGLELDWYKEYWIYTTKMIDYGIDSVLGEDDQTTIHLVRKLQMPMPLEVVVTTRNDEKYTYYIPLRIMRGEKAPESDNWTVMEDWPWTHPEYEFVIDIPKEEISRIEIDPSGRIVDMDPEDNTVTY